MQRSLSFDNQWEQTVNDINRLVHIHVSEQSKVDRYEGDLMPVLKSIILRKKVL